MSGAGTSAFDALIEGGVTTVGLREPVARGTLSGRTELTSVVRVTAARRAFRGHTDSAIPLLEASDPSS